jgi:predicted outer membrane lipoprotein
LSFPALLAHALVGKKDLPIPEWLFAWGAGLVLILTFVLLTAMWREPKLEDERWRPAPGWLSAIVAGPPAAILAGAVGIALLGVTVWAGLSGTESPDRNFAITFVFVTAWLGLVVLSVLFGDVFRAFNPWRAIARVFAAIFTAVSGQRHPAPLAYPGWLGRWPAAIGLLGFLWLELVYGESGFGSVGLEPRIVAIAVLLYSVYTLVAMSLFGIERWLERGETFSVYFGMFASISAVSVRQGRLGFRRLLSGSRDWTAGIAGSAAIVLVTIGGTAYDGAREGVLDGLAGTMFDALGDAGLSPILSQRLTGTILMAATIAAVVAIFYAGIAGMRTVGGKVGEMDTNQLARLFVHSFIPIALAYLVAHYFTLVLYQEQAQFTYLLNDPLGDGSNLFGLSMDPINYQLVGANAVSYIQVAALVIGHAAALVVAHDRAVAMFGDSRVAARSQYWMLALMVGFTTLGLFLLSYANQ